MSNATMEQRLADPQDLQNRIHALGREALEGARPLSDLLGEAFAELRSALGTVRTLQTELTSLRGALAQERLPRLRPIQKDDGASARNGDGPELRFPAVASPPPAEGFPRPVVNLFARPVPGGPAGLEASLRARIAGALYLGTLGAGDRLPSIRELARRTGLNHKVVRRVYRSLEEGGFVEVRDRSGIYVSGADEGADGLDPAQAWIAGVVADSVGRGVNAAELPRLLGRSVGARRLRCACMESTEDDRFALCREVGERFGLETVPMSPGDGASAADLRDADVVVTTPFHAAEVRLSLDPGQSLVIACLHPEWRRAVKRDRRGDHDGEPVRLLCVERAAGERLRHSFGPEIAQGVRVVTVDGAAEADGAGLRSGGVATLAAWSRLGGGNPPEGLRVPPYLSPHTIRRLAEVVVRLNGRGAAA